MLCALELVNVAGLQLTVLARGNLERHALAFVEGLITVHLDLGEVNEEIFAIGLGNKSVALLGVEPLDSAFRNDTFLFPPARLTSGYSNTGAKPSSLLGARYNYTLTSANFLGEFTLLHHLRS